MILNLLNVNSKLFKFFIYLTFPSPMNVGKSAVRKLSNVRQNLQTLNFNNQVLAGRWKVCRTETFQCPPGLGNVKFQQPISVSNCIFLPTKFGCQ